MSQQSVREVHGTIAIRQHCVFHWRQPESGYQRVVDIEAQHCERCIRELLQMPGFLFNDLRTQR